jgi:hypothetical protein
MAMSFKKMLQVLIFSKNIIVILGGYDGNKLKKSYKFLTHVTNPWPWALP